MGARAQMHERRASRRGTALALLLAVAVGASAFATAAPVRAQGDEPAIEQYTDPFADLGTGRRAPAWNPFSRDFAAPLSPRVRRRLARVEDGPALQMLLAQVATERARTGAESAVAPSGPRRRAAAGEDEEPSVFGSAASSAFDGEGPQGTLLAIGLVAVTAVGVAAAWRRRRQRLG